MAAHQPESFLGIYQDRPLDQFSSAAEIERVLAGNRQKLMGIAQAFQEINRALQRDPRLSRPMQPAGAVRRHKQVQGTVEDRRLEPNRLPSEEQPPMSKLSQTELNENSKILGQKDRKLHRQSSRLATQAEVETPEEEDLQKAVDVGLLERALNEFDVPGIGFKQWLEELLQNQSGGTKTRLEVSGEEFLASISSIFRRASLNKPCWQDLAWMQSQFPRYSLSGDVSLAAEEVVAVGKRCFESALSKLLEEVGQDCLPPPVHYPVPMKATPPAVSPRTTETGVPSGSGVASARSTPGREHMVTPSPVSSTGSLSGTSAGYGFTYLGSSTRPGLGPTRMRMPPQRQNSTPNPTTVPPVRMNQQQLQHHATADGAVFSARTPLNSARQSQQQHQHPLQQQQPLQQSARGLRQSRQASPTPVASARTPLNSARSQPQPQSQPVLSARQMKQATPPPPPQSSPVPQQPLLSPRVNLMHKASSGKPPSLMNPVLQSTARFQAPPRSARSGATLEQL